MSTSGDRVDYYKVAPDLVRHLVALHDDLSSASVDQRLRRLVELRVSHLNGCAYCCALHCRQLRDLGEDQRRLDTLAAWDEAGLFTEAERSALEWAEALTLVSQRRAPDAVYRSLTDHFSERQIVELSLVIALMNAWNRLAVGFGRSARG